MDFAYTQDQLDLAALCREIFADTYPADRARELYESGEPSHCPELWSALADAGVLGLPFDESVGGAGASLVELGVAFREAGRALAPTTLASTIHAALLVDRLGSASQRAAYLPRIVAGTLLATVAVAEPATDDDLALLECTAKPTATGWSLTGVKSVVADAALADVWVVAAVVNRGSAQARAEFFLVSPAAVGTSVRAHHAFGDNALGVVTLDSVEVSDEARLAGGSESEPGQPGQPGESGAVAGYRRCAQVMSALRSMEMLGGAEHVLARTADYVRVRHQFGRPIGSFQAVQHHVADMAIDVAGTEPVALRAVWLLAAGRPAGAEVAVASSWASRAFVDATVRAHQLHGGMGFAREGTLYLWSERAKSLELRTGGRRGQFEAIAASLFDGR